MSGQVSRGSAGEYQADERAGVARISWRVSGRRAGSPVLLPAATYGYQLTVKKAQVRTTHFFLPGHLGKVESKFTKTALSSPRGPYLLCCSSRAFPGVTWGPRRLTLLPPPPPTSPTSPRQ